MAKPTRRTFLAGAAAGVVTPGILASGVSASEPQLVWKTSDWKVAEFQKIVMHPARVKQVYDVKPINDGMFLNNVKNSLDGLHFGFGVPENQIKIVAALHGPSNMLNYDDYVWKKYKIGEWFKVTDPTTGQPAERNIYYPAVSRPAGEKAIEDPNDGRSIYQAKTIQDLQSRGVQFLSCHTATEEQAKMLVHRLQLSVASEDVVKEMLAHTIPGAMVVASMVAAIALLQAEGRYTYITV